MEKVYRLDITVEQFLNACDSTELQEVDMLIGTAKYRAKMNGTAEVSKDSRYHGKFKQLQIPE